MSTRKPKAPDTTSHAPARRTSETSLVDRLLDRIRGQGRFDTGIPHLTFYRFDGPTSPSGYLLEPSICMIFQGSKKVLLGEQSHTFDGSRFFVTSVDLPVIAEVLEASPKQPYLGMVLTLDRMEIARLVMESSLPHAKNSMAGEVIELGEVSRQLLSAVMRMLELLEEPEFIPLLSPLIQREIYLRLLMSECGPKIRQIAVGGSPTHQISRAIGWIKSNLNKRLRVEDLASLAGMSVSTLHHHFRSLTSLSPLQFQKQLRLSRARLLMVDEHLDASTAAFEVGYESPSQFSREYGRMFGAPPLRDIKELARQSSRIGKPQYP
ncbi:AraC-like DNA-binding protein [Roseimicrobium gellanilyticum]|uniref:AraC-like DNA-binding protein n=1 Tax=Roseimicrobium gellanilyticum TaxID=748857 RepID=A0A366HPA6_9BACT|nr:AraC family transcriptional regulator [Roseimicrobium gellanilyticum]RBP43815.1 AraC-like DNA-binding protein [Roseimicrobium gellanilyticum]